MTAADPAPDPEREAMMSALFASLVMQQTRMALLLLGRMPNPQTGKPSRDLDGARLFIDQLEMLEARTRGNLDAHERTLLKQSLMELHLAFVETSQQPADAPQAADTKPAEPAASPASQSAAESPPAATNIEAGSTEAGDEGKKKFTKKY